VASTRERHELPGFAGDLQVSSAERGLSPHAPEGGRWTRHNLRRTL
jgi:hypothetical protein